MITETMFFTRKTRFFWKTQFFWSINRVFQHLSGQNVDKLNFWREKHSFLFIDRKTRFLDRKTQNSKRVYPIIAHLACPAVFRKTLFFLINRVYLLKNLVFLINRVYQKNKVFQEINLVFLINRVFQEINSVYRKTRFFEG